MAIGRMPVASGSSVPAWPTFCALVRRLTRVTTSVEVMPSPLSITSQPLMGTPLRLRPRIVFSLDGAAGPLVAQEALEAGRLVEQLVGHELEPRRVLQAHRPGHAAGQLPRGALEGGLGLPAQGPAELAREDGGRAQVPADPDLADGDAAPGQVRLVQLAAHQPPGDDGTPLLGDAKLAARVGGGGETARGRGPHASAGQPPPATRPGRPGAAGPPSRGAGGPRRAVG